VGASPSGATRRATHFGRSPGAARFADCDLGHDAHLRPVDVAAGLRCAFVERRAWSAERLSRKAHEPRRVAEKVGGAVVASAGVPTLKAGGARAVVAAEAGLALRVERARTAEGRTSRDPHRLQVAPVLPDIEDPRRVGAEPHVARLPLARLAQDGAASRRTDGLATEIRPAETPTKRASGTQCAARAPAFDDAARVTMLVVAPAKVAWWSPCNPKERPWPSRARLGPRSLQAADAGLPEVQQCGARTSTTPHRCIRCVTPSRRVPLQETRTRTARSCGELRRPRGARIALSKCA